MKIIVCLDDKDGMLFLGRRLSQDSVLREHVLEMAWGGVLWMNAYSEKQFPAAEQIRVAEDFLEKAGAGEYCFVEDPKGLTTKNVEQLILYRWNRHYPSDVKFPMADFVPRMVLQSTCEFVGSSHDCITQEVYRL